MRLRLFILALLVGCFISSGCQKETIRKAPAANEAAPASLQGIHLELVGQIHWQGTRKLQSQTNASDLREILQLPESALLLNQTLDKFSFAPWIFAERERDTNAASLLRPLLDDVLSEESYLVISRSEEERLPYYTWAIQLSGARGELWNTNISSFLKVFAKAQPSLGKPGAWIFSMTDGTPAIFELSSTNGWTLISLAPQPNPVLEDLAQRLGVDPQCPAVWTSNYWFEIQIDPKRWTAISDLKLPIGLPQTEISVMGYGKDIRIDAELNFSKPLNLALESWNIPTDLIDAGLSSFTAVRGLKSQIRSLPDSRKIDADYVPDQAFFWAHRGLPMQTYVSVPMTNAPDAVSRLTDWILANESLWAGTNEYAGFQKSQNTDGVEWKGLPYLWPFVRSTKANQIDLVYGGMFPSGDIFPIGLDAFKALDRTNLVYYDWEVGSARVDEWIFMAQFARFVLEKAQLPAKSASVLWLKAISPKLGNSLTEVTLTGPSQLSFVRKSTIGMTGVELQLFADWLESPQFPKGLRMITPEGRTEKTRFDSAE